jgi:hypothetical protein
MTSSSTVVIQNLAYLVGAIVLAIVIGVAVWLRHRPPRSVDANVESFHRGLRALAPDSDRPMIRPVGLRIQPPYAAPAPPAEVDGQDVEAADGETPDTDGAPDHQVQVDDGEPGDDEPEDGESEAVTAAVTPADGAKSGDEGTHEEGTGSADAVDTPGPVEITEPVGNTDAVDVVDLSKQAHHTAAGEAAGDWAGAETG